jgi:predicted transcriptional regulator
MAFAYVFSDRDVDVETVINVPNGHLPPEVVALRELRLKSGLSQEKASVAIGKAKTYVLRVETGKAILDKQTEKKLMELYKKEEKKE